MPNAESIKQSFGIILVAVSNISSYFENAFWEGAYYSPYRFRIVKQVIPDSQAAVSAFDYKDRPSFPDLFQLSDHMTDLAFCLSCPYRTG